MGHHGSFVWAAYGIAVLVIVWNIYRPCRLYHRAVRKVAIFHKQHKTIEQHTNVIKKAEIKCTVDASQREEVK